MSNKNLIIPLVTDQYFDCKDEGNRRVEIVKGLIRLLRSENSANKSSGIAVIANVLPNELHFRSRQFIDAGANLSRHIIGFDDDNYIKETARLIFRLYELSK